MNNSNDASEIQSLDEDKKLREYSDALLALRKDGLNRIAELHQEMLSIRKDKMLYSAERQKRLAECRGKIEEARLTAQKNRDEESRLEKEAVAYADSLSREYISRVAQTENAAIAEQKQNFAQEIQKIRLDFASREASIRASGISSAEMKEEIAAARYEKKSAVYDAKSRLASAVERCKGAKNQAFVDHVQKNRSLRNGKSKFTEDFMLSLNDYIYKFKLSKFFLDNGLYLAILVFFIVCIILAPLSGNGNLLSLPNIFTILEQSSTRMFYALGVAGLILLAGTDLSVGRMVALGAVVTGLVLHPGQNIVTFFGMGPWDFSAIPMAVRVLMALFSSVFLCVLFSAFAGVFSARLKIHPFISTLATQLIIYGLLFFGTSGTPVGSIDSGIKDLLGGRWVLGVINGELVTFPKLIIPAAVAITVAWFIWNKTTFGKNMYAVGGNSEAASVSGISVFKVTLGVFVMAGIFYGFGAFFEAFKANASAGTGQGYELDAIAACVVGGISFNGGIGKIGGAVLGVIIFTSLTYCLTFLGIDTNLQFVFKGFIIIAAVALDSIKYLKRK
ncbi:ABC transporter permease subunit [Treponema sp.]|uniref:galactose/methyl galactoside ABC transporter permease MglC n=1 Tax=Treponema sp. TaxID=166 RepID=UPI003F1108F5